MSQRKVAFTDEPKSKKKKRDNIQDELWIHPKHSVPEKATNWCWNFMSFDSAINATQAQCRLCAALLVYVSLGPNGPTQSCKGLEDHLQGGIHGFKHIPSNLQRSDSIQSVSTLTRIWAPKGKVFTNTGNISEFWVRSGLGRDVITKGYTRRAFPQDIPLDFKKSDLEKGITQRSLDEIEIMKSEFKNTGVAGEIDGGRKQRRDFTTLLLSGKFVETFVLGWTETKVNMVNWLTETVKDKEKKFECMISSMSNDNCVRIDAAMHQVCLELGILHTRCLPHSYQLSLKDLFNGKVSICIKMK